MANASYVYEVARSDSRAAEEFAIQMNHGRGITICAYCNLPPSAQT